MNSGLYNINITSHITVSWTRISCNGSPSTQSNGKVNSKINGEEDFHSRRMWCVLHNIPLNFYLITVFQWTFQWPRNPDGSLSRQAYLQVNFDFVLDRLATFSSFLSLNQYPGISCTEWPQKFFVLAWSRQWRRARTARLLFQQFVLFGRSRSARLITNGVYTWVSEWVSEWHICISEPPQETRFSASRLHEFKNCVSEYLCSIVGIDSYLLIISLWQISKLRSFQPDSHAMTGFS